MASERAEDMKAAGASRVVALVKENIVNEVDDFRKGFWSEEVLMDEERRFFTALGGGELHKPFSGSAAFLLAMLSPWSKTRTKRHNALAGEAGVTGNMTGEGFVAGGVYVMRLDGKASYAFLEEDLGDRAPVDDVIEAVKAAKLGEEFTTAPADESGQRKTWKEWAGRTTGASGYQIGDLARGLTKGCRLKAWK